MSSMEEFYFHNLSRGSSEKSEKMYQMNVFPQYLLSWWNQTLETSNVFVK